MKRYVIATVKSWNIEEYNRLVLKYPEHQFALVKSKNELTASFLDEYNPEYVFFPHWSWMIPKDVFENYDCVVFHSTDLPFGRGGSPIQNLLARGIYNTKISAIKVCSDIDAGPVYHKEQVDISDGSVDDILRKISHIIFERMIPLFFEKDLVPQEQTGTVVNFDRRKPEQSEIPNGLSQKQIYDYIRMLDGEGYPPAFVRYENGKIIFTEAEIRDDIVYAKSRFVENAEE